MYLFVLGSKEISWSSDKIDHLLSIVYLKPHISLPYFYVHVLPVKHRQWSDSDRKSKIITVTGYSSIIVSSCQLWNQPAVKLHDPLPLLPSWLIAAPRLQQPMKNTMNQLIAVPCRFKERVYCRIVWFTGKHYLTRIKLGYGQG